MNPSRTCRARLERPHRGRAAGRGTAPALLVITTSLVFATSSLAGTPAVGASGRVAGVAHDSGGSPLEVSLTLTSDSGGTVPAAGDSVVILFRSSSAADILYSSAQGDLSYPGTYSLSGGTMALDFKAPGFSHRASFSFSNRDTSVKLPFQALSEESGSSDWQVTPVDPIGTAESVAEAVSAASADGASQTDIVSATATYLAAVSGAPIVADPSFSAITARDDATYHAASRLPAARLLAMISHPSAPARSHTAAGSFGRRSRRGPAIGNLRPANAAQPAASKITQIEEFPTDELLTFANGLTVDVSLLNGFTSNGPFTQFTQGPFYGTPAVVQVPHSPQNGISDPPDKTALFIEPFLSSDTRTWSLQNGYSVYKGVQSLGGTYLNADMATLTKDGYDVTLLHDREVTVAGIIAALAGKSPGFIEFSTHGNSNGSLLTNDYMGHSQQGASNNVIALAKSLGLSARGKNPALGLGTSPAYDGSDNVPLYVELYPPFWRWLEKQKGANFTHSLVYINACLTDASSALRNAIQARAFFAYKVSVVTQLGDAVENYLVQMLVKPSFTSEEVYYNMLRLDSTSQMVYSQDSVFEDAFTKQSKGNANPEPGEAAGPTTNILGNLDAWGYANGREINYIGNGWLTSNKNVDQGGIFYLITAARYGQDIDKGLANLAVCWNAWWKHKKLPDISSPYCQQANAGYPPTQNDYDYAIYLLSGKKGPFVGTYVPRFTLNDGKSP